MSTVDTGRTVTFQVIGTPASQGSKVPVPTKQGWRIKDSAEKNLRPWRATVDAAARIAREELGDTMDGPLELSVQFRFARPGSHYGTGKNAGVLKPNAPHLCSVGKPGGIDLDKAIRSIGDSLVTAGLIRDDARIARLTNVEKVYADPSDPWTGATITVTELGQAAHDWHTMRGIGGQR